MDDIPDFYTGPPLDSTDLRYRDEFLDDIWENLKTSHVLLTAPRRTGKTSVMDHLVENPQNEYIVLKENVQDLDHPADLLLSLLARFHDEHPSFLRDNLSKGWNLLKKAFEKLESASVSEFKVILRNADPNWKENWRKHGDDLLTQLRKHGSPILIIIDELPDMLLHLRENDPALLKPFLAWFRTQRQVPLKDDAVRWLVGGSINLSSTLDSEDMIDLINDLEDMPLPILTDEQVHDFVTTMLDARNVPFDDQLPKTLAQHLGRPIPLFMQILTQDLYRHWKKLPQPRPLTEQDVVQTFDALVRSSSAQDKLQHFYSRLRRYYHEPKLSAAHSILSQLSLSSDGLSRNSLLIEFQRNISESGLTYPPYEQKRLFNELLRDLANDFYIEEVSEDQYDFASGLLKSWWRKYYG